MAGVKGRSGGARPGAGSKPKPPQLLQVKPDGDTPLDILLAIARDETVDVMARARAASAAAQYVHVRRHDGGKRDTDARKAKSAAGGKFKPNAPPKLNLVNNDRE